MLRRTPLRAKRAEPRRKAPERVKHKRMKPKAKAPPTAAERRHMDRVGQMPCVVTGRPGTVLHHVMHMPGKRRRRDHRFVVPLIPELHNMGDQSVHALGGEARFLEVHGVDLVAWAVREWERSCDD